MAPSYSAHEVQYYNWLFLLCDSDRDGVIDVENDKPWLQNSGLQTDVVDQVCTRIAFYAVKLARTYQY